jgi:acetate kinase
MPEAILVINAGSSSLKFSVFDVGDGVVPGLSFKGQIERIGTRPRLVAENQAGAILVDKSYSAAEVAGHDGAIGALASWLGTRDDGMSLIAAGHRVAHGGIDFSEPVLIDEGVMASLEKLVPLVPLHQPANLAGIRALKARRPALAQVACFDTAFHRNHSEVAQRFALPDAFYREGIRRYGFHGLSYEYIAGKMAFLAPELAMGRVIVAHLGSGASMCAISGGRSVDSTMAFSSLDGLAMGTRCGQLDPGVVLYLLRTRGMSADAVEGLLYRDCGLLGLSGFSADVRDLLASDKPAAALALDYFVDRACREIGGLAAVLDGLDAIVFTAGIGEHAAEIRARICRRVAWLGVRLDTAANRAGGPRITLPDSPISAWVVPTNEELVIARHTARLVRSTTARRVPG